ncbi:MAG: hypothetical protein JWQ84_339 [Mucilaginibacter sp.]|jgi:hypothetical protein|nr:hypothetical protein [Mucilaginibacter sp.]MDB5015507.1 hypothetical protein [Mucilaginibacter sp.]MDB5138487.1 hypothetical protein [Mucilaginibacter sp.]
MALTHERRFFCVFYKWNVFWFLMAACLLQSCATKEKKVFESDCDAGIAFKRVSFTRLIANIEQYDHQYVEVYGTYKEGKEESALFNDSLFVSHSSDHAIWINFSQDCPLYLSGTHVGLFQYNDGKFTQLNHKNITIRGQIDVRHKGHLGSYKGSMDHVSFVRL